MAIRLLVVDDKQEKLKAILEVIRATGIERGYVDIAQSQVDARRFLRENIYDLMIIDLALPRSPEDPPDPDGGRQLLRDVRQRTSFNMPKHIVGITAFEELRAASQEEFGQSLSAVIQFDPSSDAWSSQLANRLTDILKADKDASTVRQFGKDVCVITALRDPEFLQLRKLEWSWQQPVPLDDCTIVTEATAEYSGNNFSIVTSYALRMGMVSSALLAQKMILAYRPRVLLMCGICAGLQGETGIGDVILADPAWDWQSGKHLLTQDGNSFAADPDQLDVAASVRSKYEMLIDDHNFWADLRNNWSGSKPKTVLEGKVGPVASGSAVVANTEVLQTIKLQHRKLVGVEMEIYGLYAAAKTCGSPSPLTFALKGVSDFADADKDDHYRQYAAYTSAHATDRLLSLMLPSVIGS